MTARSRSPRRKQESTAHVEGLFSLADIPVSPAPANAERPAAGPAARRAPSKPGRGRSAQIPFLLGLPEVTVAESGPEPLVVATVAVPAVAPAPSRPTARPRPERVAAERASAERAAGRVPEEQPSRSAASGTRPVPQGARDLLADGRRSLDQALHASVPAERYVAAHLAALRGAAAVLATRVRPARSQRGSAWELLVKVAPEFEEWAAFYAAGAVKRQAAQAGVGQSVSGREADELVRQTALFLELVAGALQGERIEHAG